MKSTLTLNFAWTPTLVLLQWFLEPWQSLKTQSQTYTYSSLQTELQGTDLKAAFMDSRFQAGLRLNIRELSYNYQWFLSRNIASQDRVGWYMQSVELQNKNQSTKNTIPGKTILQKWKRDAFLNEKSSSPLALLYKKC
jgi:hypothetical protein